MQKLIVPGLAMVLTASPLSADQPVRRYHKLVETRIGTDLHGHTYPGASAPFGMVQLSPDTRIEGWDACAGYHYSDSTILGFSHTHLSGTGIADYGDILLTPTIRFRDPGLGDADAYRLRFIHDQESVSAGFYQVTFPDEGIHVELTATERVGVHRYTFPANNGGSIIVNLAHGLGPDQVIDSGIRVVSSNQLSGSRRSRGWAKDQQVFFFLESSTPFTATRIFRDRVLQPEATEATGTDVRCVLLFDRALSEPVLIKVGLSFVSTEGARHNLETEVPGWDFDQVRRETASSWDTELGKIDVQGGTPEQERTFYTALYRTMLVPNIASDVDGSYRGMDQQIHRTDQFTPYTVFSLWDTFRAEHPLLALIDRKRTADFVRTLLVKYEQSGVLPVWELASNETWTMIGYHSIPVILDAFVKKIGGFSAEQALEAMIASAMMDHHGLDAYRSFGYIPADKEGESVSKTLEYAYDDWCIARMAELLGRHEEAAYFYNRSVSYRNLFDPETFLMRPKSNSTWVEPFDPRSVTFHYTEANPWQYSFFAPHDPEGLVRLMGGSTRFAGRLDSLFLADPELSGRRQPDITGLIGQYAHGNEPSHHVAYLYNYAGQPWKTQRIVRTIMDSLYTSLPDGLCGNEDCGQMSAWYVLSALGFYQVCPGEPVYTVGTPLFPSATIHLENGNSFTVSAEGTSSERPFVHQATYQGRPLPDPFLHHDSLMAGGILRFTMGSEPAADTAFVSLAGVASAAPPLPAFRNAGGRFTDSLLVGISCADPGASLFYTMDGGEPDSSAQLYTEPLLLRASATIRAIAILPDGGSSNSVSAAFLRFTPVGTIRLLSPYSAQYTGGGDDALLDSRLGRLDWHLGAWQGYEGIPFEAIVDLGSVREIGRVTLGALQDQNAWIFFPTEVRFAVSADGSNYGTEKIHKNEFPENHPESTRLEFSADFAGAPARYLRVKAGTSGLCPDWHKGAGGKSWLFLDELTVETVK